MKIVIPLTILLIDFQECFIQSHWYMMVRKVHGMILHLLSRIPDWRDHQLCKWRDLWVKKIKANLLQNYFLKIIDKTKDIIDIEQSESNSLIFSIKLST